MGGIAILDRWLGKVSLIKSHLSRDLGAQGKLADGHEGSSEHTRLIQTSSARALIGHLLFAGSSSQQADVVLALKAYSLLGEKNM